MSNTKKIKNGAFRLELLGRVFFITADAPELVETCLQATYAAAYARTETEPENVFYRLELRRRGAGPESEAVRPDGAAALTLNEKNRTYSAETPPRESPDALRFVFETVAAFTQSALKRDNIFFIHAAAVRWKEKAVLIAGPNGCGKSTLMRALVLRGAVYLADDAAPVRLNPGTAAAALPSMETVTVKNLDREETERLSAAGFTPGPDPRFMSPPPGRAEAPVRAIFFPEFADSTRGVLSLTNKAALLKILKLNKTPLSDGEYEQWFQSACDLAGSTAAARIEIIPGSRFPVSRILDFCDRI